MSYTSVYLMPKSGPVEDVRVFRNSWGWAMRIWNSIAKEYARLDHFPISDPKKSQQVWDLWKDARLPPSHKAVLMMTFDYCTVEWDRLDRAAGDLRTFERDFPAGEFVSHLSEMADLFDELAASGRASMVGVCFYPMSVSEDVWGVHGEETEDCDCRMYDNSIDAGKEPFVSRMFGVYDSLGDPRMASEPNEP